MTKPMQKKRNTTITYTPKIEIATGNVENRLELRKTSEEKFDYWK